MHKLAKRLINAASKEDSRDASAVINEISCLDIEEQKQILSTKNESSYNALQALVGSRYFKSNEEDGISILNRILNKSINVFNIDEYKDFYTSTTKGNYTPLHTAIKNGNYKAAVVILQETRTLLGSDKEGYKEYLATENINGFNAVTTYERNIRLEQIDSRLNTPDDLLDRELYGSDFNRHRQTFLAREKFKTVNMKGFYR